MKYSQLPRFICALLLVATAAFSGLSSATTQLCLKKEVSSDGINWFDANTDAEAVPVSGMAHFRFSAFKCPESWGGMYNIVISDPQLNVEQLVADLSGDESDFTPSVFTTQVPDYCQGYEGNVENIAFAEGYSMISDTPRYASDNAWVKCETLVVGGEGCTPGYWKQPHHLDSWPISDTTLFSEVFDRVITIRIKKQGEITDPTLLQALGANGGKVNTAARHAAAAYLNAMSTGVAYDMDSSGVINAFQMSYDSNNYGAIIENLVDYNEQGCPLN
ncbi:hypothetical protein [Aliikangiella sp. IMCC44632]